jgi:hypothetical protein
MSFGKRWLSSLLDDVLHPDPSDEPIALALVVMSHMVLAEKPESNFAIKIIVYLYS